MCLCGQKDGRTEGQKDGRTEGREDATPFSPWRLLLWVPGPSLAKDQRDGRNVAKTLNW